MCRLIFLLGFLSLSMSQPCVVRADDPKDLSLDPSKDKRYTLVWHITFRPDNVYFVTIENPDNFFDFELALCKEMRHHEKLAVYFLDPDKINIVDDEVPEKILYAEKLRKKTNNLKGDGYDE